MLPKRNQYRQQDQQSGGHRVLDRVNHGRQRKPNQCTLAFTLTDIGRDRWRMAIVKINQPGSASIRQQVSVSKLAQCPHVRVEPRPVGRGGDKTGRINRPDGTRPEFRDTKNSYSSLPGRPDNRHHRSNGGTSSYYLVDP